MAGGPVLPSEDHVIKPSRLFGLYSVVNGVVVFPDHPKSIDDNVDHADICHSESDTEDTWKGFGVAHAETDGKFGGIIGEDWSD